MIPGLQLCLGRLGGCGKDTATLELGRKNLSKITVREGLKKTSKCVCCTTTVRLKSFELSCPRQKVSGETVRGGEVRGVRN